MIYHGISCRNGSAKALFGRLLAELLEHRCHVEKCSKQVERKHASIIVFMTMPSMFVTGTVILKMLPKPHPANSATSS